MIEAANFDEDLFHARGTILKLDYRIKRRRDFRSDGRLDLINASSEDSELAIERDKGVVGRDEHRKVVRRDWRDGRCGTDGFG